MTVFQNIFLEETATNILLIYVQSTSGIDDKKSERMSLVC
jgi:hypothetical protein